MLNCEWHLPNVKPTHRRTTMWTKPAYNDLRLGFEVTLYIANR